MPPVLDGVKVYNNTITIRDGWNSGSLGPLHCHVYNNTVLNDSQSEMPESDVGHFYLAAAVNVIATITSSKDGKGDGIENHGLGGNRIFNNIIVNAAGLICLLTRCRWSRYFCFWCFHGKDSAVMILFNDIINPKSDGIFQSVKGKRNVIASNLINEPG